MAYGFADLPAGVAQEVEATFETLRGSLPEEEARRVAFRRLSHKGFYQTSQGWKQLGPDIADKINLRQASKQPDGYYAVFDCDVFYPNAVKGDGAEFNEDNISRAVENTNRSVQSGGQAPGLLKGHPSPLGKAVSGEQQAFGKGINFRQSPRGENWVRCDIVDIDPDVYEDWKKGRYGGLSAGFVNDAGDLNLRFGHIALLGGDMQALSYLPRTEIFSAPDTLCYSADTRWYSTALTKGKTIMADYKAFSERFGALSQAYAAMASGEPGAENKVKEARAQYQACFAEETPAAPAAAPEEHADAAQDKALIADVIGGGQEDAPAAPEPSPEQMAAYAAYQAGFNAAKAKFAANPSDETVVPEKAELKPEEPKASLELAAAGGSQFAAQVAGVQQENRVLKQQVAALLGKTARSEFSAEVSKYRAAGHQFNADLAVDLLMEAGPNKQLRDKIFRLIQGTARTGSALTAGAQFAADGADNPKPRKEADSAAQVSEVLKDLQKSMPGVTFSAEDVKLGNIWMQ